MPIMIHSDAFVPSDRIGSHCSMPKYMTQAETSSGIRRQKRKRWKRNEMGWTWLTTGRNGAIPEPTYVSNDACHSI